MACGSKWHVAPKGVPPGTPCRTTHATLALLNSNNRAPVATRPLKKTLQRRRLGTDRRQASSKG